MAKAKKGVVFLVIFLLIGGTLGYAGLLLVEKGKLEQDKAFLTQELQKSREQEQIQRQELQTISSQLRQAEDEKNKLQTRVSKAEQQVEDLYAEVSAATKEAEELSTRLERARKDRDELVEKVQELTKTNQELQENRTVAASPADQQTTSSARTAETTPVIQTAQPVAPDQSNDEYWADILRQKAALEVDLENLRSEISKSAVEIVEVKQKNADLQIRLDELQKEKQQIAEQIAKKENVINKLSVDLARERNTSKFIADKVEGLTDENKDMRNQIKQLVATKSALEKTIVKMSQEKNQIEQQLGETEAVIQSKIDEIWEIKKSLDEAIDQASFKPPSSASDVELPPIVVSSEGPYAGYGEGTGAAGFNGNVVSINDENNFVIVDIGETSGVRLGDILNVYRDSKYIARLEVIQVRKDIAAADIKDQWTNVEIGDAVR